MIKPYFTQLRGLGLALLSAMLLFSCNQIEPFTVDDLNADANEMSSSFGLDPFGFGGMENARTYAATDCENFCIDPDDPEYSVQRSTIANNSGSSSNTQNRVFTYDVYNTLTGFKLDWNYDANNPAGRRLRIKVSGAGFDGAKTYTSNEVQSSGSGSHTFNFDATWAACGVVSIRAEILDGTDITDIKSTQNTTYSLIGACLGCDDELTVDLQCGETNTATFTFYAEEAGPIVIQGGLNANATIEAASSNVLERNETHPAVTSGATASVTRWEGDVEACEEVTVTVSWTGPANIGDWTAKRGEDTLGEVLGEDVSCEEED